MNPIPSDHVCIALDTIDMVEANRLVSMLAPAAGWFKIGLKLFSAHGPRAVEMVRSAGRNVFLDLKLHDIPSQVAGAVRAISAMGAGMTTVHGTGGETMMRAAAEAGAEGGIAVIAVTVLTSMSGEEHDRLWPGVDVAESVARLAGFAVGAGLAGAVVSPRELKAVRAGVPAGFRLVVPGIRAAGAGRCHAMPPGLIAGPIGSDDQARTGSARQAIAAGADVIVIGRPVTGAADPMTALEEVLAIQ